MYLIIMFGFRIYIRVIGNRPICYAIYIVASAQVLLYKRELYGYDEMLYHLYAVYMYVNGVKIVLL